MEKVKMVADEIPGYDYGSPNIAVPYHYAGI